MIRRLLPLALVFCLSAMVASTGCKSKKKAVKAGEKAVDKRGGKKQQNAQFEPEEKSNAPDEKRAPDPEGEKLQDDSLEKVSRERYSSIRKDFYRILGVSQKEQQLLIEVQYSGGCGDTEFQLVWNGSLMKSMPPQARLKLGFIDNDDCEALVNKKLRFNLHPLKSSGKTVVLRIEDWEKPVKFQFEGE